MKCKYNILFVDDEPRILEGLRRSLRSMRDQWDMDFVGGGQEAIEILRSEPYDIIITDMRMPGMNGVELLNYVKEHYPRMVRLALSGQTSKQMILRSVGPIHQYLPKPCDAETLKGTLSHIGSLREILQNDKLQAVISQMESLPCLSSLYNQLVEELQSDEVSVKKVAGIISQDVAMMAKILQMVNSSFFGVRQEVKNVRQAITLLGLETVKALVLSVKIFSQFEEIQVKGFDLNLLWHHSLTVGQWACKIARHEHMSDRSAGYALIAGMLHDVGKLALASGVPGEYEQVLEAVGQQGIDLCAAEGQMIGTTHSKIGFYLLGLWGFPLRILNTVSFHHHPSQIQENSPAILPVVYACNLFYHEISEPQGRFSVEAAFDEEYVRSQGLTEKIQHWRDLCLEAVEISS